MTRGSDFREPHGTVFVLRVERASKTILFFRASQPAAALRDGTLRGTERSISGSQVSEGCDALSRLLQLVPVMARQRRGAQCLKLLGIVETLETTCESRPDCRVGLQRINDRVGVA